MLKGIAMNTKELKKLINFFRLQGISPTVKELCGTSIYLNQYQTRSGS